MGQRSAWRHGSTLRPRTLAQLEDVLPVMTMSLSEAMRCECDQVVPPGSAIANFLNSAPWMKGRLL